MTPFFGVWRGLSGVVGLFTGRAFELNDEQPSAELQAAEHAADSDDRPGGRPPDIKVPDKIRIKLDAPLFARRANSGHGAVNAGKIQIIMFREKMLMNSPRCRFPRCTFLFTLLFVLAAVLTASALRAGPVYQWSVGVPGYHGKKRAYLWISPKCRRVRGLLVGIQNMLEQPAFGDPIIRRACAQSGLAIVWIAPGSTANNDSGLSLGNQFGPPGKAGASLQGALDRLAKASGYGEIKNAPLLIFGHSAAASFVYGMPEWDPSRIIALIPDKCGFPIRGQGPLPAGIPVFHLEAQWSEWGSGWGSLVKWDISDFINARRHWPKSFVGEFLDSGTGHFDWCEKSAPLVALFIKEAVKYRVPAHAPVNGRVKLRPIHRRTGWVIDITKYGTADSHAMPFAAFDGDPSHASWFFNRKLAQAVNRYMVRMNRKKPELIDFVVNGKPASLKQNGFASLGAHFNPDGVTFNVQARYLNHSPTRKLLNGGAAGHANAPIKFWTIGSGALKQVGPDTFKVYLHRGGVRRQGPPWEPWIIAYSPGNSRFQSTDRPAHIWLPITNHAGKRQTIAFSSPANVKAGTKSIRLYATSSLGLPVQFFVVSGPVKLAADNRTLRFTAIPPRATFPMKVIIGAWQWGRAVHPRVQTAGPVYRSFFIDK